MKFAQLLQSVSMPQGLAGPHALEQTWKGMSSMDVDTLAGHGVIFFKWELPDLLLAFVSSIEPSVLNSHKVNITSSWGKKKKDFFSFIFILPFKFLAVLVRFWQMESPSLVSFFHLPRFFLCWQGRNWKVCRVFWVSVQNNALFLVTECFALQAIVLDEASVLHDHRSWEICVQSLCMLCV